MTQEEFDRRQVRLEYNWALIAAMMAEVKASPRWQWRRNRRLLDEAWRLTGENTDMIMEFWRS